MGRSTTSPHQELPTVSFTAVPGDYLKINGIMDGQARSYGFNDGKDWMRPDHYVRYIEPLENELAAQVEYDMDEQDQEWLDTINKERKAKSQNKVTYEIFEVIMDRLEKGWFDLTKNIRKPDMALPSEDTTCAICDDSEVENTNAIVFCDGCNLAVHQDCYGVPYIPEGQWLCRKCTVSPENPVSCLLCPNEGGAFKQNTAGEWVHLLCAIWIPETRVANETFMEPITGTDKISKQRWRLKCSICDVREGACIQCTKSSCFLAFHVTCARREKLLMPMKASAGLEPPPLQCFCEKHLPRERIKPRLEALATEAVATASLEDDPKAAKAARAYAKGYRPGPPIVPSILIRRIERYVDKVKIRGAVDFIELVARYWSLKREARRGAPLLKRLHLEPWTASAGGEVQTDEEKSRKLELMKAVRDDLERVRELVDQIRQREIVKCDRVRTIHSVVSNTILPHADAMRLALERIWGYDKQDIFKNPVSRADVPDYYDVIKRPMCWTIIDARLDGHQYWDVERFKFDITLVFDNAMAYNASGSPIFKLAQRLKNVALPILANLDSLRTSAPSQITPAPNEADTHAEATASEGPKLLSAVFQTPADECPVGDLEPPFELLSLFKSSGIAEESSIVLSSNPLDSIFSYELPVDKPQPRSKKRSGRRTTVTKAKANTLDASPSFRASVQRSQSTAATGNGQAVGVDNSLSTTSSAGPSSETGPPASTEEYKRRKAKPTLPGQNTSVVPDVSNQDSFKMFNSGWILPDSERRGGRKAIDRHAILPTTLRRRGKITSVRAESSAATNSPLALGSDLVGQSSAHPGLSPNDLESRHVQLPLGSPVPELGAPMPPQPPKHQGSGHVESPGGRADDHIESSADAAVGRALTPSSRAEHDTLEQLDSRELDSSSALFQVSEGSSHAPLPALNTDSNLDLSLQALRSDVRSATGAPSPAPEQSQSGLANVRTGSTPRNTAIESPHPSPNSRQHLSLEPPPPTHVRSDISLHSHHAGSASLAGSDVEGHDSVAHTWDDGPLPGYAVSSFEVLPPSPDPSTPESQRGMFPSHEWTFSHPTVDGSQASPADNSLQPSQLASDAANPDMLPDSVEPGPSIIPLPVNNPDPSTPPTRANVDLHLTPVTRESSKEVGPQDSSLSSPLPPLRHNEKIVYDPDGTAVIEEIDSPTARRRNHFDKRTRKPDDDPVQDPVKSRTRAGYRGRGKGKGRGRGKSELGASDPTKLGIFDPTEKIEGGTLVWAKIGGHPYFPAVIWERDDPALPDVPRALVRKSTASQHLVQFFDQGRRWSLVEIKNLRMMLDHPSLDAYMLNPRPSNSLHAKNQVRQAYRIAQAEAEDRKAADVDDVADEEVAPDALADREGARDAV